MGNLEPLDRVALARYQRERREKNAPLWASYFGRMASRYREWADEYERRAEKLKTEIGEQS